MPNISWQTIRFIIIGVSGALIYLLASFALMTYLHLEAYLASIFAYATSFSFAYLGQKIWAFRSIAPHSRTLTRYALLQLFCVSFAATFSQFAANQGNLSALAVSTFASFLTAFISYFVSNYWVFADPLDNSDPIPLKPVTNLRNHRPNSFSLRQDLMNLSNLKSFIDTPAFLFTVLIAFTVFKLWLVSEFAIYGETLADHDDQHFVNQAASIIQGHWLGDYNQFTLIKGPAYPAWIALLYQLHIPLLMAQSALYILACIGLTLIIRKTTRSYSIAAISFMILVFYLDTFPRVTREGLYTPVTLGIFVLLAYCYQNLTKQLWILIINLSLLGLLFFVFWTIREEGVWLTPSLIIFAIFFIFKTLVHNPFSTRERVIRTVLLTLPVFIFMTLVMLVKQINTRYYQSDNIVEMSDPAYLAGYGSLTRVIPSQAKQYIPVTAETRQQIYQNSPSFRLLKNSIENSGWDELGCRISIAMCGEISGGFFMWAFRDAVATAGFYRNGETAQHYYEQLKQEIDQACNDKALHCLPERKTMLPVIDHKNMLYILDSFKRGINFLFSIHILQRENLVAHFFKGSTGDPAHLDYFKKYVKGEFSPLETNPSLSAYQIDKANTPQYSMNAKISQYYVFCWPWALISALILYGISLITCIRDHQLDFNIVFNSALIVAVLTRIVLLAIIDATSFWGINELYMSPVFPLALAFIVLSHIDFYCRLNKEKLYLYNK